ncbi:hypothetical protein [Bacillus sp. EB01]|uniref:hypothetical protein n=1 Tax=Bacillus sp. EB01 TaxID=1347086 RepID=UPI0005C4B402|nr:hypothetical protein [Bacillus sp. EB01]
MFIAFICLVGIVGLAAWYSIPKGINQEFDGFVYGVGGKSNQINEKVTITIKGSYHKKIFNQDRFKGTIDIKGDVPKDIIIDNKEVEVVFLGNNGTLSFRDYSHPTDRNTYGNLYINNDFSELTIIVYDLVESGSDNATYEWDPEGGLLISGPATTRKEAISISNKLNGDLLKPLE